MELDKKVVQKLLKQYLNRFDALIYSYINTIPKLEVTERITIQIEENSKRIDIVTRYSDELYDLINDNFSNIHMESTCYICHGIVSRYYNCPNGHSDMLCMDCLFDMMISNEDTYCGLCRKPIKIEQERLGASLASKFEKLTTNQFEKPIDNDPLLWHFRKCHNPEYTGIFANFRTILLTA